MIVCFQQNQNYWFLYSRPEMYDRRTVCLIAVIAASILWGFLGLFVRGLADLGMSPMQMTCLRYVIMAVALGAFMLLRDRSLFRVDSRSILIMVIIGVLGSSLNSVCYFASMERISLSLSTVLQYLSPFIVVLLSVPLFGERLTRNKVLALVLAFTGCVLCTGVLSQSSELDGLGIALGVMSGLFYSVYTLGSRMVTKGYSVVTISFYSALSAGLVLLPFSDIPSAVGIMSVSMDALLLMLGLGLLMTLTTFGLYMYGIKGLGAGKASIITFLEPMAATVVGLAVYGEMVTVSIVAGMSMVLVSLVLISRDG